MTGQPGPIGSLFGFFVFMKFQIPMALYLVLSELSLEELHDFHNRNYQNTKADGNKVLGQVYMGKPEGICKERNLTNQCGSKQGTNRCNQENLILSV